MEKELALQRIKETKILLTILQNEARTVQLKIADVDLDIGMARALLKSKGLHEEPSATGDESEQLLTDVDSSASETDEEAGMSTHESYV